LRKEQSDKQSTHVTKKNLLLKSSGKIKRIIPLGHVPPSLRMFQRSLEHLREHNVQWKEDVISMKKKRRKKRREKRNQSQKQKTQHLPPLLHFHQNHLNKRQTKSSTQVWVKQMWCEAKEKERKKLFWICSLFGLTSTTQEEIFISNAYCSTDLTLRCKFASSITPKTCFFFFGSLGSEISLAPKYDCFLRPPYLSEGTTKYKRAAGG